MNIEEIREYCLQKPFSSECLPFDDVSLVIKLFDKMFILIPLDEPVSISLKCDPEYALTLREAYCGIVPAWHFNKKYWNQVFIDSDVPESIIKHLIDHSFFEVLKKLPRAKRDLLSYYNND